MAQQTINVGTAENDNTGDKVRVGGQAINANFTELYGQFFEDTGQSPSVLLPKLPSYTTAQLNALTAANFNGAWVRCSDGDVSGSPVAECLAYCNGTNWLVVLLGNPVGT